MNKIFIESIHGGKRAVVYEDDLLCQYTLSLESEEMRVGDIYIGVIEKILSDGMMFVSVGKNKVFVQPSGKYKNEKYKCSSELLVTVSKEAAEEKRAVALPYAVITGKYTVISEENRKPGISHRITDEEERKRLALIASKYPDYDIIMRTDASGASDEEIIAEIETGISRIKELGRRATYLKAPLLLQKGEDPVEKAVKNYIKTDEDRIYVDNKEDCQKYEATYKNVTLYNGEYSLFTEYGINGSLKKLLQRKIWLKSGGSIVIDRTEAMTVIDVNSANAGKGKDILSKVNTEAAKEIARQLRLRNLSGMIIIDFIGDKNSKATESLKNEFASIIKKDPIRTIILGMTELGLMQLTRQRVGKPLDKIIGCKCPECDGRGYVWKKI